jgi:hypothetical protein
MGHEGGIYSLAVTYPWSEDPDAGEIRVIELNDPISASSLDVLVQSVNALTEELRHIRFP